MTKKTDNLKILFVSTSDMSGGAARAAYRIHKGIQNIGVSSMMFVKSKQSKDDTVIPLQYFQKRNYIAKIFRWGINKIKNKVQHYRWHKYPNKDSIYMSDLRSCSINGAFQKLDYNILHLHWTNLRFLNLKELQKVKKPIVWTLHDSWAFCGICHYFFDCSKYKTHCEHCKYLHSNQIKDLSWQIFEKKKKYLSNLDLHIVTPSNWLAKCARESALLGNYSIDVIPNCIDTDLFMQKDRYLACESLKLNSNKIYLLYGAMNATSDKRKGFKELVTSLCYLETNYDTSNVELIVFGSDKPIEAFELKMPIHYVGYIKDDKKMVDLYNIADVMLVPSLTENLSCTIMESLSCATPVVAFNIGGNSDMIEHKINGWLATDEMNMAKGIDWCLKNNQDNVMGRNGRRKVLNNYAIDIVAHKYLKLYTSILL